MDVETIVATWIRASEGRMPPEPDLFFRFIAAWVAFNAIYGHRYGANVGDRAGALKFAEDRENSAKHSDCMREESYRAAVETLAHSGIVNLKNNRVVNIDEPANFQQVMAAIYQVRCNLFHGGKFAGNPRDREVVKAAHTVLAPHLSTHHLQLAA